MAQKIPLVYIQNIYRKEKKFDNKGVTGKCQSQIITRCNLVLFSTVEYKTRYVSVFCLPMRGLIKKV